MNPAKQIPIVLTATIIPNTGSGPRADWEYRRAEYASAARFYRQFGKVYFLENSTYPLQNDPDFLPAENFAVRQFPPSTQPGRGKGYQEFEMLDAWISSESSLPLSWVKISGRYLLHNVANLISAWENRGSLCQLYIDQLARVRLARSYVFCIETGYYLPHFLGLYRRCDDTRGDWIERVIFQELKEDRNRPYETLPVQPEISAVTGTTGHHMQPSAIRHTVKSLFRRVNRILDRRYLWYQKRG